MGPWVLALVVVFAIGAVTVVPAVSQPKIPADFSLDQGKDSPGKVNFSHEAHKGKVEKCTGCHTKLFKMKKGGTGALTMEKMKAGEQCGACHAAKAAAGAVASFAAEDKANCEKCHKK